MDQLLPRGYEITADNKIKKIVSSGLGWQIYLTSSNLYALAVVPSLYELWSSEYLLPGGLFLDGNFPNCKVFLSSGEYIVSSLGQGPFPENNGQIEAFSIAFCTAVKVFPDANFNDAIYIEKYSLILPVPQGEDEQHTDNDVVYGKWLTGGVGVSIFAFDRVSRIMSWLPKEQLSKAVESAGFEIPSLTDSEDSKINGEKEKPETNYQIGLPQDDIGFKLVGRPELERFFNENIVDIVLHQEQYKRMGISFPGATILYGPPGCGKTYAVEKLTEYLGWRRFDIDSSTIASSYIHDTSKKISEVFTAAIKATPSVLVIDEMEAFLSDRGMAGPSGMHHIEEVAEFLRRIPEAVSNGVLVFAMTNMIESIDPAILRRGRFDHIVEVRMANAEEIEALLLDRFKELPIDESVAAKVIAQELDGHPLSDVAFVLREAGRYAVKRGLPAMSQDCFMDAVGLLPKGKKRNPIGFVNS